MPSTTDVEILRLCITRCLRRPDPIQQEAKDLEAEILQERFGRGKTKPPSITGFTAKNIDRCTELYTLTELQLIAEKNGVKTTGSPLAICARLLQKGLLSVTRRPRSESE
jgi:hypothetical protein